MAYTINITSEKIELKPLKSYSEKMMKKLKAGKIKERLIAVVTIAGDMGQIDTSEATIKELVNMGFQKNAMEKKEYAADRVLGVSTNLNFKRKQVAHTEFYVLVKKLSKVK